MTSPLLKASRTYRDSVDQVMIDHEWAMICWELQELIEVGLGVFTSYERLDAKWRDAVRKGARVADAGEVAELREICSMLIAARTKVIEFVDRSECRGYLVDGATQFRSTEIIPFDERPLDVPFTDSEFETLASAGNKAPETACAADDEL